MIEPKHIIEIDASGLRQKTKTEYVVSWAPTQSELDKCDAEYVMYFVFVRERLTTEEFLAKYSMKPSSRCCVHYVAPELTNDDAEEWLRTWIEQTEQTMWLRTWIEQTEQTMWHAPAGTKRGVLNLTPYIKDTKC